MEEPSHTLESPPPQAVQAPPPAPVVPSQSSKFKQRYLQSQEQLEGSTRSHAIFKGYDSDEGVEVAMHVLSLSHPVDRDGSLSHLLITGGQEETLSSHLVRVHDAMQEGVEGGGWRLHYITPIISAGTLQGYIARIDDVRLRVVRKWCRQVLSGLLYLASLRRVVHYDVKVWTRISTYSMIHVLILIL